MVEKTSYNRRNIKSLKLIKKTSITLNENSIKNSKNLIIKKLST